MRRSYSLLATAGLLAFAGCKSAQPGGSPMEGLKPALLIGPEATSQAAPPVELPTREAGRLCLRTAQEFEKSGQTEDAIRLYEKARSDDPSTAPVATRRLAVLYDKVGNFAKSGAEYDLLLKDHPKDADLLNDLGYSHYCRGEWSVAEACLLRAVQADANHKRAWVNLGLAQAQLEKWEESYSSFTKAVRPADAQCNIAFVLAAQGKTAEAKSRYQQALILDPRSQLAQAALAKLDRPIGEVAPASAPAAPTTHSARYNAEEAAAKVPSFSELEARLQREGKLPSRSGDQGATTAPAP